MEQVNPPWIVSDVSFQSTVYHIPLPGIRILTESDLSEALALELAPFNIRVLIVIPGGFRTDFLSGNLEPEAPMTKDYEGTPLHTALASFHAYNGNQPGDPAKGMRRVVEVVENTGLGEDKQRLLRLPLGTDCLERAWSKINALKRDLNGFDSVAKSTDLD